MVVRMEQQPNEEKGKEEDPRIQSAAVSLDGLFQLQYDRCYFYFIPRENVKRKTVISIGCKEFLFSYLKKKILLFLFNFIFHPSYFDISIYQENKQEMSTFPYFSTLSLKISLQLFGQMVNLGTKKYFHYSHS